MGFVEFALAAVGTTADVVGIAQAIRAANQEDSTSFFKCFQLSVKRHAPRLAEFSSFNDIGSVSVDAGKFDAAVSKVNSRSDTHELLGAASPIPDEVVAAFQAAISIPDCKASATVVAPVAREVLRAALQDYVHQLSTATHALLTGQAAESRRAEERHDETLSKLDQLLTKLDDEPYLDPTLVQQEGSRAQFRNPFRIVKAEEFDHDYALLAELFNAPETYDQIRGPGNLVLEGGRGCGKSMILRSMSVLAALQVESIRRSLQSGPQRQLKFSEAGIDYFGVYIKLARGYFHEWTSDCALTQTAATQLFQHSFNMLMLRSLLDTLTDARDASVLSLPGGQASLLAKQIGGLIQIDKSVDTIDGLRELITREEHHVRNFMGHMRLGVANPVYHGHHTSVHEFLSQACDIVRHSVPDLTHARVFFLLDEYENLAEFQQTVVNTVAKLRPASLTLKIASRPCGVRSIADLNSEQIQRPRDYEVVPLDYDVTSSSYGALLRQIATKRLNAQQYTQTDLEKLLEPAPPYHPVGEERVRAALLAMQAEDSVDVSAGASDERLHQFGEALVFRLSRSSRQPRTYSGLGDFIALSSGIISNFLELCKTAFYLAEGEGLNVRFGEIIPWSTQNRAVYYVSRASLDYIARNVEGVGPRLSRFVQDLGDVFRAKLINHNSEPEAARVRIADPENLDLSTSAALAETLEEATKWSVLHSSGPAMSYLPKHSTEVRSSDYYLNRILAPTLRISPRPRWGCRFLVEELVKMISESQRSGARKALIRKHSGVQVVNEPERPLLSEEQPA